MEWHRESLIVNFKHYAVLMLVGFLGPVDSPAEWLHATPVQRIDKGKSVGFLRVETRLDGVDSFRKVQAPIAVRVAYVEGFGPVTELSDWLSFQTELEELNVICVQLSDADVEAILRLPNLSRLSLRGCRLSTSQLERLSTEPSIQEVDLHGVSLASIELANRQ